MNSIVYEDFLEDYFKYYFYHLGGVQTDKKTFSDFRLITPSDYWLHDFYKPGAIQTKN